MFQRPRQCDAKLIYFRPVSDHLDPRIEGDFVGCSIGWVDIASNLDACTSCALHNIKQNCTMTCARNFRQLCQMFCATIRNTIGKFSKTCVTLQRDTFHFDIGIGAIRLLQKEINTAVGAVFLFRLST